MPELTSDMLRVHDELRLPVSTQPVVARAARFDTYTIEVVQDLPEAIAHVVDLVGSASVAVVTDETVESLYGATLVSGLREAGVEPLVRALPAGEETKSLARAVELWHWLADSDIARRDVLVAFGGGVIADLTGWVASAYMRGVPYVNVPTTLMAQVDGALGGKVGVNHPVAKNLLGAFHQPLGVVASVDVLRTISDRHLRAGLAEAIKKAVIASPELWAFIAAHADAILARDGAALERLVRSAAAIKTSLIERDPYEADLRRPLNFGHTVGHPLETVSGYGPVLHGEAVSVGMVVESRIAAARGLLDGTLLGGIVDLLRRCGLPTTAGDLRARIDGEDVVAAMEKVRLIRAGSLRYVLPVRIGETLIADDVMGEEVRAALRASGFPFSSSSD